MRIASMVAEAVTSVVLSRRQREHVTRVQVADAGHGWDRFGMSPAGVAIGLSVVRHLYEHYFRVCSHGIHNIPKAGPTILAANHSGMLPLDGMMLWADVVLRTEPPRVPRPVADFFVPALPFVSILFARAGMIAGSRGNVHAALDEGQILEVFPEGVRGIGKPFSERYQLQRWSVGHAELAIRHRAAIVPVAIVGAEEAWPQLAKISTPAAWGLPYLPVPASPVPLPARFHLHYGAPIYVAAEHEPAEADDPAVLRRTADRVRDAVADLITHGLASRTGVFR